MTPQPVTPHDRLIRIVSIVIAAAMMILILLPPSVLPFRKSLPILWGFSILFFAIMAYRCHYARKQGMTGYVRKTMITGVILLVILILATYIVF